MSRPFEELDFQPTRLGDLSLRRRRIPSLDDLEVFEIKLGDDFLMSSLFTRVEEALAELGLAGLASGQCDVVVGGLGLGCTAAAALEQPATRSLIVVEALAPVIDWHRRGLVPLGPALAADPRCRFVNGDFFALAADSGQGFDPAEPGRKFDAVLLDIDHSPQNWLHTQHGSFYGCDGLRKLASHLRAGGIFAMWSDGGADENFQKNLRAVFASVEAHEVTFYNPLQDCDSSSTVYVACTEP